MTDPATGTPSREFDYEYPGNGITMLIVGIVLMLTVVGIPFGILTLVGLTLVNPNQSKVALLFGTYKGTLRKAGFYWVNPFTVRRPISLRAHNFNSDKLKVNDLRGNPIEIGAVVVWRVRDTAQAAFDVEDHVSYVEVQTESAVRHLASSHPYDTPNDDETSLRGNSEAINDQLKGELEQRLERAGIEVLEARLSHLAYAPEIAGAMLQRQQAEAVIDARMRIVEGATSMVQMAIENLEGGSVVELDNERKAQMVSNLLVVLCSDRGTQPVVNAGTLYG
ncbi:MAG: SPFH domain-containing protein [Planctomycetes bacterium]|nr:SPFH domain-containing protein [Planctomycetota bacterium]